MPKDGGQAGRVRDHTRTHNAQQRHRAREKEATTAHSMKQGRFVAQENDGARNAERGQKECAAYAVHCILFCS